jgi:hypothetical protein
VEAGSNTSTVALKIVGGDKKECLETQTVAAIVNDRPILSSERILYTDYDSRCSIEKKIILAMSLNGLGAKKTDWQ